MTQEDKQLLLRDLSARLPYGVKICYTNNHKINGDLVGIVGENVIMFSSGRADFPISDIKPYLRSLSSMTDEESKELENLYNSTANYISAGMPIFNIQTLSIILDWFNAHQFDYRGLIPKGLAIDKQLM